MISYKELEDYIKTRKIKLKLDKASLKNKYCNNIMTFDIETTNGFLKDNIVKPFDYNIKDYDEYEKVASMYIWMFSIDDIVFYGRTWEEFKEFIETLNYFLKNRMAIVYVHNLAFEFQFLQSVFNMKDVFARNTRKVIYCTLEDFKITFRCSLILSNMSLEKLATNYNLKVKKLTGNLDYIKLRNYKTKLTEEELDYCEHDCLVLYNYIKNVELVKYGTIKNIPLTSTGKIRELFKDVLRKIDPQWGIKNWKQKTALLTPSTQNFLDLVTCFSGGYTHANAYYAGKILENVNSIDFTSSYPAVMLQEKFPSTQFHILKNVKTIEDLDVENYAYIIKCRLSNVITKKSMSYLSYSKSKNCIGEVLDNGRIWAADSLEITVTEQDLLIINDFYDIEKIEFLEVKRSYKKYLPKIFLEFIIQIYQSKCTLKNKLKTLEKNTDDYDITETDLRVAKAFLNSLYGMSVTNYIADVIIFENIKGWSINKIGIQEIKEKLNDMFLKETALFPYQWGVWVTAYARRNIFYGIEQIDEDVVYSDTDSIKFLNDHSDVIENYNKIVKNKIEKMGRENNIDISTILGIGEFDLEGKSDKFITLGAKKYCCEKNGKLEITVSGVNKKTGVVALKNDINNFKPGLIFGYVTSGKLEKFYNDDQPVFELKDEYGNIQTVTHKTGICLKPTTYKLGITEEYNNFKIERQSAGSSFLNKL